MIVNRDPVRAGLDAHRFQADPRHARALASGHEQPVTPQLRTAIERAEKKLSAQQKIIFRLRHYENHSLEDIAEMLGLRAGTVRAHLFRAVHKVREELAGWRAPARRGGYHDDD